MGTQAASAIGQAQVQATHCSPPCMCMGRAYNSTCTHACCACAQLSRPAARIPAPHTHRCCPCGRMRRACAACGRPLSTLRVGIAAKYSNPMPSQPSLSCMLPCAAVACCLVCMWTKNQLQPSKLLQAA